MKISLIQRVLLQFCGVCFFFSALVINNHFECVPLKFIIYTYIYMYMMTREREREREELSSDTVMVVRQSGSFYVPAFVKLSCQRQNLLLRAFQVDSN